MSKPLEAPAFAAMALIGSIDIFPCLFGRPRLSARYGQDLTRLSLKSADLNGTTN